MPKIRIELDDTGVVAAFNRLIQIGQDPTSVIRTIAAALEFKAQAAFENERGPAVGRK